MGRGPTTTTGGDTEPGGDPSRDREWAVQGDAASAHSTPGPAIPEDSAVESVIGRWQIAACSSTIRLCHFWRIRPLRCPNRDGDLGVLNWAWGWCFDVDLEAGPFERERLPRVQCALEDYGDDGRTMLDDGLEHLAMWSACSR